MKEFSIRFSVVGHVKQTVTVTDDAMTAEKLQELLDGGHVVTSIQEGGQVVEFVQDATTEWDTKEKIIGVVENVDNYCEYEDYEVFEEVITPQTHFTDNAGKTLTRDEVKKLAKKAMIDGGDAGPVDTSIEKMSDDQLFLEATDENCNFITE